MKLTIEQAKAILAVKTGADVYNYGTAKALRAVHIHGFVDIGKAQMVTGDGSGREPYFGAIATKEGLRAARIRLQRVSR